MTDWDIFGARVAADGRVLDSPSLIICGLAPSLQTSPRSPPTAAIISSSGATGAARAAPSTEPSWAATAAWQRPTASRSAPRVTSSTRPPSGRGHELSRGLAGLSQQHLDQVRFGYFWRSRHWHWRAGHQRNRHLHENEFAVSSGRRSRTARTISSSGKIIQSPATTFMAPASAPTASCSRRMAFPSARRSTRNAHRPSPRSTAISLSLGRIFAIARRTSSMPTSARRECSGTARCLTPGVSKSSRPATAEWSPGVAGNATELLVVWQDFRDNPAALCPAFMERAPSDRLIHSSSPTSPSAPRPCRIDAGDWIR